MVKTNWWLIVLVTIVVAVISTIVTVSIMQNSGPLLSPGVFNNATMGPTTFKSDW